VSENFQRTEFSIAVEDRVMLAVFFCSLLIFSWNCLQAIRAISAMGQCTADARSPHGNLSVHLERYGDCDAAALADEARQAVEPKE
jgi:hypothetical protein